MNIIKKTIRELSQSPRIFIILRKILENNFKGEKRVLAEHFSCETWEKVLDIGCGTGEFSVFFNPENYTGIDIEKKYIEYAQKNYSGKFIVGDATHIPFSDGSFQKIAIVGVLHHLDDEMSNSVLKEARRVLASGGTMLVMEDVNRPENSFLTRRLHRLDNGDFIRDKRAYEELVSKHFMVQKNFDMHSGLCPYQVFILK